MGQGCKIPHLLIRASAEAAHSSREDFTNHQLRGRTEKQEEGRRALCRLGSQHQPSGSRSLTGAASPYVVYLQGGAFVAHGHRTEHHLPQHVDIGRWSRVLRTEISQSEHETEHGNVLLPLVNTALSANLWPLAERVDSTLKL